MYGKNHFLIQNLLKEHNLTSANFMTKTAREMFVLKMPLTDPSNVEREIVEQNISVR